MRSYDGFAQLLSARTDPDFYYRNEQAILSLYAKQRRIYRKNKMDQWIDNYGIDHLLDALASGEDDLASYCRKHEIKPRDVMKLIKKNNRLPEYCEALSMYADALVSGAVRIVKQTQPTPIAIQKSSLTVSTMLNVAKWYHGKAQSYISHLTTQSGIEGAPTIHISVSRPSLEAHEIAILKSPPERIIDDDYTALPVTIDHSKQ